MIRFSHYPTSQTVQFFRICGTIEQHVKSSTPVPVSTVVQSLTCDPVRIRLRAVHDNPRLQRGSLILVEDVMMSRRAPAPKAA